MSKYTLICEEDSFLISSTNKTTKEFEAESLDEILLNITQFLRGAGFCFDGDLQVVQPETEELWYSGSSSCCGGSDLIFDEYPQCDDIYVNVGDGDIIINTDLPADWSPFATEETTEKPKKKRK